MIDFVESYWNQLELVWKFLVVIFTIALLYFSKSADTKVNQGQGHLQFGSEFGFLALAAFMVIFLRLPCVFYLAGNPDESQWIAGAVTLRSDPRFWISVDGLTSGPLVIYALTLIGLTGAQTHYLSAHVLVLVFWCVLILPLLYVAIRTHFDSAVAKTSIIPLVLCISLLTHIDWVAYNGELLVALLTTITICLHALWIKREHHLWLGFFTGIIIGLFPLAKPHGVPIGLMLACLICLPYAVRRDGRILLLILGGLTPTILLGFYLATTGAFYDFWQSYVVSNLIYANAKGGPLSFLLIMLQDSKVVLALTGQLKYFLFFWIFASLCGAFWLFVYRKRLGRSHIWLALASALVVLTAIYCVLQTGETYNHYWNLVLVPLVALLSVQYGCLKGVVGANRAWIAFVSLTVLAPGALTLVSVRHEPSLLEALHQRPLGRGSSLVSEEIMRHARKDDRMAIWGWAPHLYVQTGLGQGTRVAHIRWEVGEGKRQEYYLNRFVKDLEERKPHIFVDAIVEASQTYSFTDRSRFGYQNYPRLKNFIDGHYRMVREVEGFRVYVWKDSDRYGSIICSPIKLATPWALVSEQQLFRHHG